ncbi:MAG: ATP-binding protein [Myxococcota bacterium]
MSDELTEDAERGTDAGGRESVSGGLAAAAMVDRLPVAVVAFDATGAIRFANPAAEQLTGRDRVALADQGLAGLFGARDARLEALLAASARDGAFAGELEILLVDGRRLAVSVEVSTLSAAPHAAIFIAAMRDIRDRREVERRFRDRARHHALVADLSTRALAGAELDALLAEAAKGLAAALGVPAVAVWRREGERLSLQASWGLEPPSGRGRAETEPSSFAGFVLARERPVVVPDFRAETRFALDAFHTQAGVVAGAGAIIAGAETPAGVLAAYALGHRGFTIQDVQLLHATAGLLGTLFERARSDLERAALQSHIQRTERLELVGRLASGFAHDFNNLMAVVLSTTRVVLSELAEDDVHREDVAEIEAAARRAAALTGDLLLLGRGDPGTPRLVRIDEVVDGLHRILNRAVGQGASLVVDLESSAWPVRVDPGRIEQIVMNLVVNARDALHPAGGTITVSVRARPADSERPAPTVVLAVEDDGAGIPQAARPHLFEPFFTTKPQGQGTGLGLATVMAIARAAGGEVRALDRVGGGTRMEVTLPAAEDVEAWEDSGPATRPSTVTGGECVLLVDDEPMVRRAVRRMLQRQGFRVVEAGDGLEALERLDAAEQPIALVLSDVTMPKLGGRELALRLAARAAAPPVVLMSAFESTLTDADSQRILRKPFTDDELRIALRTRLYGLPGLEP